MGMERRIYPRCNVYACCCDPPGNRLRTHDLHAPLAHFRRASLPHDLQRLRGNRDAKTSRNDDRACRRSRRLHRGGIASGKRAAGAEQQGKGGPDAKHAECLAERDPPSTYSTPTPKAQPRNAAAARPPHGSGPEATPGQLRNGGLDLRALRRTKLSRPCRCAAPHRPLGLFPREIRLPLRNDSGAFAASTLVNGG